MRVLRAESARADLDSIEAYFGERNLDATLLMLDRITSVEALLVSHPRIGHPTMAAGLTGIPKTTQPR